MTDESQITVVEKKPMSENPQFYKKVQKNEQVTAVYYEMTSPIPFTTKVKKMETETHTVDSKVKDSHSVFYLFGFIPLGISETYKVTKEKMTTTTYFCELTPDMMAWVESMKPYCLDMVRNRGRLSFRPTDEEINQTKEFQVYPFLVEYGGVTGIGWRRYTRIHDTLPA